MIEAKTDCDSQNLPRAYTILTGQHDNIGDMVLRRALGKSILRNRSIHAYVGSAPISYVRGLGLKDSDVIYRSIGRWFHSAVFALATDSRSEFVGNPGEISSSQHEAALGAVSSLVALQARLFRRRAFRIGVGARDRHRPWSLPHELAAKLFSPNVWRDADSARLFGGKLVAPDLAFLLSSANSARSLDSRPFVAISYRPGTQVPMSQDLELIAKWSIDNSLAPIVVTQVTSDSATNCQLASKLGCKHFDVFKDGGRDPEESVRAIYSQSAIVLSNRIHSLIIGVTEGAVPAALLRSEDVKVDRTLLASGISGAVCRADLSDADVYSFLTDRLKRFAQIPEVVHEARIQLARVLPEESRLDHLL